MRVLLVDSGFRFSTTEVTAGFHHALIKLGNDVIFYDTKVALEFAKTSLAARKIYQGAPYTINDVCEIASSNILLYSVLHKVDLVLCVHGYFVPKEIIKSLKDIGIKTCLYLTDEPQQVDMSSEYSKEYDFVFTNDEATVNCHHNCCYLPTAYNSFLFDKALSADYNKEDYSSDILICGSFYPERISFLNNPVLKSVLKKYNTIFVGNKASQLRQIYSDCVRGDMVPLSEMVRYYAGAKIVVDIPRNEDKSEFGKTNSKDIKATNLTPRVFEATALGALVFTNVNRKDTLDKLYPDGGVFTFNDAVDLASCLEYSMSFNDFNMQKIGSVAKAQTNAKHTYIERTKQLLKVINLENIDSRIISNTLLPNITQTLTLSTQSRWRDQWEDNFNNNKVEFSSGHDFQSIIDKIRKANDRRSGTAYLISNGPSLANVEHELWDAIENKTNNDYFFTMNGAINICGDAFYDCVDRYFSIMIHPTSDVQTHFADPLSIQHMLLASSVIHPDVIKSWKEKGGQISFFNTISNLDMKKDVPLPVIGSGLTVAYSALDIILKMGFKKIILIGLDMSYVDGYKYYKTDTDGVNVLDSIKFNENDKYVGQADVNGNLVITSPVMLRCKNLMLDLIEKYSDILFINVSPGILHSKNILYRPEYLITKEI